MWDDGDQMLVNLEPDDPADPHTFELSAELRDARGLHRRGRPGGGAVQAGRV